MPAVRPDFSTVKSLMLYEPGGIRCRQCMRLFRTKNRSRIAPRHIRRHLENLNSDIHVSDNDESEEEGKGIRATAISNIDTTWRF